MLANLLLWSCSFECFELHLSCTLSHSCLQKKISSHAPIVRSIKTNEKMKRRIWHLPQYYNLIKTMMMIQRRRKPSFACSKGDHRGNYWCLAYFLCWLQETKFNQRFIPQDKTGFRFWRRSLSWNVLWMAMCISLVLSQSFRSQTPLYPRYIFIHSFAYFSSRKQ